MTLRQYFTQWQIRAISFGGKLFNFYFQAFLKNFLKAGSQRTVQKLKKKRKGVPNSFYLFIIDLSG